MARAKLILFACLLGALAACGSPAYQSLRSERDIPELAALLDQQPELEQTMVTTFGDAGRPLDVAVFEELASSDRVVIMIHGVLANSKAWRFVTGPLSDDCDLMLVDMPGNGASQAPAPFVLKRDDPDGYSTKAMAYRMTEAIAARIAARPKPPQRIAIVAHSLGTLITLRLLADETIAPFDRDWMDLVDQMVLISPIDPAMPYGPPSLEAVASASWLYVELGELTGFLRGKVATGSRRSFVDPTMLPREQVDDLLEIIRDAHRRAVAQDVLKTVFPTVVIDGLYYPDWDQTETVVRRHRALGSKEQIQCLLMIGERDEVAPGSMAYRLATQLADARIVTIGHTKHSPHIERAGLTAGIMRQFLADGTLPDMGEVHLHMIEERVIEP